MAGKKVVLKHRGFMAIGISVEQAPVVEARQLAHHLPIADPTLLAGKS